MALHLVRRRRRSTPKDVFPSVVHTVPDAILTNTTKANLGNIPGSVPGELILFFLSIDSSSATQTVGVTGSGWVKLGDYVAPGSDKLVVLAAVYGSASNLVSVSWGTARHCAWVGCRIRDWSGVLAQVQVAGDTGTGGTTASRNPDPPQLTPDLGVRKYLWLACGNKATAAAAPTQSPPQYSEPVRSVCHNSSSLTDTGLAVAWRQHEAASDDPEGFPVTLTGAWAAATVAVPPR